MEARLERRLTGSQGGVLSTGLHCITCLLLGQYSIVASRRQVKSNTCTCHSTTGEHNGCQHLNSQEDPYSVSNTHLTEFLPVSDPDSPAPVSTNLIVEKMMISNVPMSYTGCVVLFLPARGFWPTYPRPLQCREQTKQAGGTLCTAGAVILALSAHTHPELVETGMVQPTWWLALPRASLLQTVTRMPVHHWETCVWTQVIYRTETSLC